jgi:hypothetical protein
MQRKSAKSYLAGVTVMIHCGSATLHHEVGLYAPHNVLILFYVCAAIARQV